MAQIVPQKTYSIGVICALATEKAAVEAMLDEEHEAPARIPGDDNDYTFGQMCGHDVAIACLPAGVTGKASAASVARDMMRSFPIRFGLMVGIAGGVPSPSADIRLGDVAVSQPTEMHGGVVQWDFGKTERDGVFRRTGTLNKPPRLLLGALQTLQAKAMRKGTNIPLHLAKMFQDNPRMEKDFCYQGADNDRLFRSDYHHTTSHDCGDCNMANLVPRELRDSDEPVVFYGNIASGDEVMKDGSTRDSIAKKEAILCFEMEAAGLVDSFPCVVIRGICDYADSHKNKRWQKYAAATAAAFAKSLLEVIKPAGAHELPKASTISYDLPFVLDGIPATPNFVGRVAELNAMEQALSPLEQEGKRRKVFVIHGMGGMGKTQLAIEYARRHAAHYSSVVWINGDDMAKLDQSLRDFVNRLPQDHIPPSLGYALNQRSNEEEAPDIKTEVLVREVVRWLSRPANSRWLMIIDNVDREDGLNLTGNSDSAFFNIVKLFPPVDRGTVIVTTRLVSLKSQFGENGLKLQIMNSEDAKAVLQNRIPAHAETANIIEKLGGLPLALAQASAYIEQTGISISAYLNYYDTKWKALMESQSNSLQEYERSILTTWSLSYEQIQKQSVFAAGLMKLWAFLDCNGFDYSLLEPALRVTDSHQLPHWLIDLANDQFEFSQALGLLYKFSLVDSMLTKDHQQSYAMHTVLHNWCMNLNSHDDSHELCSTAIILVGSRVESWRSKSSRQVDRMLLPHVLQLHQYIRRSGWMSSTQTEIASLNHMVGVLIRHERLQEAKIMADSAYKSALMNAGDRNPVTLSAAHHAGWANTELGHFREATDMYFVALDGKRAVYGLKDPSTLKTVRNLGHLLMRERQHLRAKELFEEALSATSESTNLKTTVQCDILDNMGLVCMTLGLRDDAYKMFIRALEGYEKLLGPHNISTLDTVCNLALYFATDDQHDRAEPLLRRALKGQEKPDAFGPNHPETIKTVQRLGNVLVALGRRDEAIQLLNRALTTREEAFGKFDERTVDVAADLYRLSMVEAEASKPTAPTSDEFTFRSEGDTWSRHPSRETPSFSSPIYALGYIGTTRNREPLAGLPLSHPASEYFMQDDKFLKPGKTSRRRSINDLWKSLVQKLSNP